MPPKKDKINKDTCLHCKLTCKVVPSNKKGGIRCSVCKFWFHPDCAGLTQEEYQQALKWKEKRDVDIWACAPCESANEALDNKIREINAKVEEVKKDVNLLGERQDKAELREQVVVTRVDSQDSEIKQLKERLAAMEADSGRNMFREVDERKIRESNVIIHKVPESQSDSASYRREADESTLQYILDCLNLGLDVGQDVKFVRRREKEPAMVGGEMPEPRPLLVGFRFQQTQERVLASSWKLGRSRDKATNEVRVVRDLTDKERKREKDLEAETKTKNLDRTEEEASKNLIYKVVGERGRRREILVQLRPGETINAEGLVDQRQESNRRWNPSSLNITPVAKERQPLGMKEQLEQITGMGVDSLDQQSKDMGDRQKVGDLVETLEGREAATEKTKTGLLGGQPKALNSKQRNLKDWQWEEVEGNGRGFKRTKSSSLSPPTEKKKSKSMLGNLRGLTL